MTEFIYKNSNGYIDADYSDKFVFSYHCRNDADPSKTSFGDVLWDGKKMPDEFIASANHITHPHSAQDLIEEARKARESTNDG